MGVIVVVSSVILVNNSRFGGAALLQNLAYDIALSVRQAQVYGISVRGFGVSNFSAGYGVHFDMSSPTTYVLFADALTVNGVYDCSNPINPTPANCELVASTDIGRGYQISALCGTKSGNEKCDYNTLDILFKRPEPDARISASNGSEVSCTINPNQCEESARIIVKSPREDEMSVAVDAVGQIRVQ